MACGFDFANDFRKVAILGTQIEGPDLEIKRIRDLHIVGQIKQKQLRKK